MLTFHENGLFFHYPENWSLERAVGEDVWTVTVQSPGTAFLLVRLDRSMAGVEDTLIATLEAMRSDYPDLDAESAVETLAGELALGHDIEFISLDSVTQAWTRCFHGLAGTVLILCQVAAADADQYEPVLRAICASMRSEEE